MTFEKSIKKIKNSTKIIQTLTIFCMQRIVKKLNKKEKTIGQESIVPNLKYLNVQNYNWYFIYTSLYCFLIFSILYIENK